MLRHSIALTLALGLALPAFAISAHAGDAPVNQTQVQSVSEDPEFEEEGEAENCEETCSQEEEICAQSCLGIEDQAQLEACEELCGEVYSECMNVCEA